MAKKDDDKWERKIQRIAGRVLRNAGSRVLTAVLVVQRTNRGFYTEHATWAVYSLNREGVFRRLAVGSPVETVKVAKAVVEKDPPAHILWMVSTPGGFGARARFGRRTRRA
jgi:hypothetical protein